ncbi:MAG: benzoyl-CoA-dihydrodiol lyase [Deltaproteobacteria bacterium]|nr:benzoyl-CoA-dihydrodiol lyase [Deltaproteobacteria bacterium]
MAEHTKEKPYRALPLDTHPDRYRHWRLESSGAVAKLSMNVRQDGPLDPSDDYVLKLNSYDLGVDIELSDALDRIRFEHPEVRALVVTSAQDKIFCSGANIYMLGSSTHSFKVNFCKYTNETRNGLEDLAERSGVATICAVNGTASGGGYELALACERIVLIDDGSSAVSFPETPLLAVLPGTGGLTRLVDKRKVRRDRADVFSTLVEGMRGKRAVEWGLIDDLVPRSKWAERVEAITNEAASKRPVRSGAGIELGPVGGNPSEKGFFGKYVTLEADGRVARLTVRAPTGPQPENAAGFRAMGDQAWAIRAFRELDHAIVRVRVEHPKVGVICIRTQGDPSAVLAADRGVLASQGDWLGREILGLMKRVMKRVDVTSKSLFAFAEPGSCFAGSLLELLLAADRSFMLNDSDHPVYLHVNGMNAGVLPSPNGLTRLETRFLKNPEQAKTALRTHTPIDTEAADELGLVTFTPDEIDWEDEIRIAIEERAGFSPDALTGMENNLRFAGPETLETKIFGRLSAWQNWIFVRPNAVGPKGALTSYGKQTMPEFDPVRT